MEAINDITLSTHLQGLKGPERGGAQQLAQDFSTLVKDSIASINRQQVVADQAAADLASGKNGNIHEVMIKMEEAEISLRMMVQMRNKVVEAYQEIMRMQV